MELAARISQNVWDTLVSGSAPEEAENLLSTQRRCSDALLLLNSFTTVPKVRTLDICIVYSWCLVMI